MKLFVTGATGFIGSHFVNAAHKSGYEVVGLRRVGSQPRIKLNKEPIWVEGLLDDDFVEILSDCDVLVHFAAFGVSPQPANWNDCFYWNVLKSIDLLNQAINSGISKIIIAGTFAEYGEEGLKYKFIPSTASLKPIGAYATSKVAFSVAAQSLCREYNIYLSYFRLFSVFGDGQYEKNLYPSLKKSALTGMDFPMTKGEQVRDFIHVEQVASKFVEELKFENINKGEPRILNVGTGKPQSVLEFSQNWWNIWNAKGKLQIGAIPYRENEVMRYVPEI
jgi:nucleoside-diphosphate-sugar epimerase